MQFFIYCNFFCQKNRFTYLLTLLTYFGPVWLIAPKVILPSCRKHLCLSGGKNLTSSTMLLWRYCKDMQTYFGYFGHAWLHSPKMIVSPYWRRPCLSACKKNKLHNSLLTILCFKESCNLIGQQHFGP